METAVTWIRIRELVKDRCVNAVGQLTIEGWYLKRVLDRAAGRST